MRHASRRDVLTAALGLTATKAISILPFGTRAYAQTPPQTAAGIVSVIREKRVSATDVVKAALARAEQMKHLNAIITLNTEGALAAAKKIDDMVAGGKPLPPLAGLPIVVKDNINTADLPTTGGTEALRNARPNANAPSLQKLIDAGAIVVGKANMHELAFGITST
ncbi:amidase family protein, partial [Pseudorhodoplanes sp.]|uniref:amidase family protein n=1 Tax=Pseudorhodoplanes sp. TaxID=1934341 RepID=UPI002CDB131A